MDMVVSSRRFSYQFPAHYRNALASIRHLHVHVPRGGRPGHRRSDLFWEAFRASNLGDETASKATWRVSSPVAHHRGLILDFTFTCMELVRLTSPGQLL